MLTRNAPRTLYRYLLRELLTIFGLGLLALSLLFMIVLGIQAVQGGYSLRIILPWIVESLPYSLFFTVPLSILVASTLGYGRFVADREYTAAVSSGLSPLHIAMPIIGISSVLCIIGLATQGTVLPDAHYKQRNITRYLVKQLEHLGDSKKGKLQIDKEDGMVYWDEIRGGRQLRGVHIEKRLPLGAISFGTTDGATVDGEEQTENPLPIPATFINASSAELLVDQRQELVSLSLFEVAVTYPNPDKGYLFPEAGLTKFHDRVHFNEITVQFPINEKTKRESDWTNSELVEKLVEYREKLAHFEAEVTRLAPQKKSDPEERELTEAEAEYAEAERWFSYYKRRVGKADSQIWFRRALALSFLAFGLLGFPLAITFRHHHKMVPFFAGIVLVVAVYYPLLLLGEALVKDQGLPASLCMMSGNVILLLISGYLGGRLLTR